MGSHLLIDYLSSPWQITSTLFLYEYHQTQLTAVSAYAILSIERHPVSTESLRSTWGIDVGGTGCFLDFRQGIVVMGAIQFRLNNHHTEIPDGKHRRGKRTIAKEKLYKTILSEICTIHPNFNIGTSTGSRGYQNPHWESPYEHWLFEPSAFKHNE